MDVTNAVYTVTVLNGSADVVWSRTLDSDGFGDGAGAVSYVGPCDGDDNPNEVQVVIDAVEVGGVALVEGVDWINPAPSTAPLVRSVSCVADNDVAVTFDVTLARAANQGFFDVAVTFSDIFCSAKLDCVRTVEGVQQPLELLTNPLTGARDFTAVLGFACTAGPGQDTVLHLDGVNVTCATGESALVDAGAGPGNLDPPFPGPAPNTTDLLFQAAVFRGVEQLGAFNKAYWNVALGLNEDLLAVASSCRISARGTATDGPLPGGATPDGTRWPYVAWDVNLTDASGALVCGRHLVNGGDGVAVRYSPSSGTRFAASFASGPAVVTDNVVACAPAGCASGGQCRVLDGAPVACDACVPGATGAICDAACPQGQCVGPVTCDQDTAAPLSCDACVDGTYGQTCELTCPQGNCLGTVVCDQDTGAPVSCTSCAAGWTGPTCQQTAAPSGCLALKLAGQTVSGVYTIDPDGPGGAAPFDAYCDMTTDGGGWTRVLHMVTGRANTTGAVGVAALAAGSTGTYTKLDDATIRALATAGQGEYMLTHIGGSSVYILRASPAEWATYSTLGWTNLRYDAKNSAGTWVLDACNGHYNNRGFSTWNDTPYGVCPVYFAGGTRYMCPHHTSGGAPGAPFYVYVR